MTDQQTLPSENAANSSQPSENIWRKEIHAKVDRYRSRRGRRIEGAFSMRFPFPPLEAESFSDAAETEACESATSELEHEFAVSVAEPACSRAVEASEAPAVAEVETADEPGFLEAPPPQPPPSARLRTRRKVIAFPRPATVPAMVHRLADPILPEQPRILDVPEELEAFPGTPLLDGLVFPPSAQQNAAASADHLELPFQVVRISQRLRAGLIDVVLVAVATALFGLVGYKMLPRILFTKPVLLTAATLPLLLWAIYEYVLVMYAGATPGMRALGMRLSTFKGGQPNWRQRRSRVIGLYFSIASLMMGLLWALVDVDALCWHDRISHTYPTNRD
jgi:uncharacterized RDD family membrane protein YckC